MKKVIYTCIVNGYDSLPQPLVVDETFDYICFSNDFSDKEKGIWKIRKIPYQNKDNTRLSRYVKLLPHKALPEYDYSLWIDGNVQITGQEFYDIINLKINNNSLICQLKHPFRDCLYDDMKRSYELDKVAYFPVLRQSIHLKLKGFPHHVGLYENNIILRKHNDSLVIKISEEWWKEYIKYSKRDQFSLMYIYWKNHFKPNYLFPADMSSRNVTFLNYVYHPSYYEREAKLKSANKLFLRFNELRKRALGKLLKI